MRIVILGDSIAAGLGVNGKCYGDLICSKFAEKYFDVELFNFAGSAMQLRESKEYINKVIDCKPDVVIIAHGITEAIIRPKETSLKYMPERWRNAGWMDPRPYFSNNRRKKIGQRIESAIRWRVKVLLIKAFGGITWDSRTNFIPTLQKTIERILNNSTAQVLLVSHSGINERYFPGSLTSLNTYKDDIQGVAKSMDTNRVVFCDISNVCSKWEDFLEDHFHPNHKGHEKIANVLYNKIDRINSDNKALMLSLPNLVN